MPSEEKEACFRRELLNWAESGNLRDFPWRQDDCGPYEVAVAEILLRRTSAERVAEVYPVLIEQFPTPAHLSAASNETIEEIIMDLGLTSRAEQLVNLGKAMDRTYPNKPISQDELQQLPGIGPYAASAIRTFCWGEPDPLVDTNTVRVAGRFFGLQTDQNTRRDPDFWSLMNGLTPESDAALFGQAILDFGALICTPDNPDCRQCPLSGECDYYNQQERYIHRTTDK